MRIRIWKGYHSTEIRRLVASAWSSENELLILCPPGLDSVEFMAHLPAGEAEFFGSWATVNENEPARRPSIEFPEPPVFGLFTSGTSGGEPKLVLYSRKNILCSLSSIVSFFDCSLIDTVFSYPQPFHTFGLLLGYVLSIDRGWNLVTGEGRYNSRFHEARVQIDSARLLTLGTPTHFQDLLSARLKIRPSYSCIVGGAPVSVALWRQLRDDLGIAYPSIGYGATEACPGIAHSHPGVEPREDGEVGTLLPHLKMNLFSGQGFEFTGDSVCLALVNEGKLEFPRQILIRDDLLLRDDGTLIYRGRNDLMLNRGGEKFSLEDIERYIRSSFALESLAVAVPHPRLGFELGLLLRSPAGAQSLETRAVRERLRERYKVGFDTSLFRWVSEIPLNASAKPDRKSALRLFDDALTFKVGST